MPFYTFYCHRADGSPLSLEVAELEGDAQAAERAARIVREHDSCATVQVFEDERLVTTARRD